MRVMFILLMFALIPTLANAEDMYPFQHSQDARRFQALTKEIRCVVCQNQAIADSNAPLAKDLRLKVYELINVQKSDADIKEYLAARYGNFILFSPPLNKFTILLWSFPFVALIGIVLVFYLLRRNLHKDVK